MGSPQLTTTDGQGRYRFDVPPGRYQVAFALINFAVTRKEVAVSAAGVQADAIPHLSRCRRPGAVATAALRFVH